MSPSDDARRRLDRLEGYLHEDAANPELLRDAFETALQAAAWDRAEFHMRHAQALASTDPGEADAWALREAHWLLAQHRWHDARARLLAIAEAPSATASPAHAAALAHDLAYVDLRLGDYAEGIVRLAPWADGEASAGRAPVVAATWLRLLHHAGEIERGMHWLAKEDAADGGLEATVAGIGGLLALDQGDYAASLRWSTHAIEAASTAPPVEALVARATLALAERRTVLARALLGRALAANPQDGRTLSAIGFCELLDQNLAAARAAFERAVRAMPGHVGTWHGLGWTAIAARDLPAARAAFDAGLALDRNFAESHGAMAVVLAMAGDEGGARESAARALGLDRSSLAARYAMALLEGGARDAEAIWRLAERLLAGKQSPLGDDLLELMRAKPGPKH